jgi:hypothetical protein
MTVRYEQSNFTQGMIDELTQARYDTTIYYKAAKLIENAMVLPQGGVRKRFGTVAVDTSGSTIAAGIEGTTLTIASAKYLIEFSPNQFFVYLENTPIAGPITTIYNLEDIRNLRPVEVNGRLILYNKNYPPYQIVNAASATNTIIARNGKSLTWGGGASIGDGRIYQMYFTGGVLPTVSGGQRVYLNRPYYVRGRPSGIVFVYENAADAALDLRGFPADISTGTRAIDFTSFGTVATFTIMNFWSISPITFQNIPTYDFTGGYFGLTFTPSALTGALGALLSITASGAVFTPAHVGGIFSGKGGIVRITTYTSPTVVSGYTISDFVFPSPTPITAPVIAPITGNLCTVSEPVWSATRGYPKCGTLFQNRLIAGHTPSLPNAVWCSRPGEFFDFDDTELLDDNAISAYPGSGRASNILAFTSGRSLVVHTDTANYSTQTFSETPLTPKTFVLLEQNQDGISDTQPLFIDGQIMYVDISGSNVKSMRWDMATSAYDLNNISVKCSTLINNPVDTAVFSNPRFFSGALALFVNQDGSLVILQTLNQEEILAFSIANSQVTSAAGVVSTSRFLHVVSSVDRVWVWVERTFNGLTAVYIEELDFTVQADRTVILNFLASGTALTNISGGGIPANTACIVNLAGSSYNIISDAAGVVRVPTPYPINTPLTVQVGLPFNARMQPLPLAYIPGTPCNPYAKKHVTDIYISYYNTIGATINGKEIPTQSLPIMLDQPTTPSTGVYQYTTMGGWDPINFNLEIAQANALPMTIRGLSYIVEIT